MKELKKQRQHNIYIVDDGSGEGYQSIFDQAKNYGVIVIKHEKNHGKGTALKTGIEYIKSVDKQITHIITADCDGQHSSTDILRLENAAKDNDDCLILGIRDFYAQGVPFRSRFGNGFSSIYFFMSTRRKCVDTQTGLRVIPKSLFPLALKTPGDRYEYEMNFLLAVAKMNYPIHTIPIHTIYEEYNRSSHFHPIKDSIRVYSTPLKYLCSSLLSCVIDLSLFVVLRI